MNAPPTTATEPTARLATDVILEVFRLNGRLLAEGERLVADLGLTAARWQVLGALAMAPAPAPVAHVARAMGLTRQNVQRIVNELVAAGLLRLAANPNHKRAALVVMTASGKAAFAAVAARQAPWVTDLAAGLKVSALKTTLATVRELRTRLESSASERSER